MAIKQTISKTCQSSAIFEGVKILTTPVVVTDLFYIKVESINGNKERANCSVSFVGEKLKFQKIFDFRPNMDGPNYIKQAYEHLKTLEEFAGCEDC